MSIESRRRIDRRIVVALAVFAYFVAYPDDLAAILLPLERVLNLSNAVSPWLYVVLGGAVIAWVLERIFSKRGAIS